METTRLLGRDKVADAVADALIGDVDAPLLLRGDRGTGKTASLAQARAMAERQGRLVVATTGSVGEKQLPFAGLHQLLRPLLPTSAALPDVQRRSLLAALGLHDPAGKDSLVVRIATLNVLSEAARPRGLLITVDDAQWLDEQTRQTLAFVARRLHGQPIVMIGASSARHEETVFGDQVQEISLDGLSELDAHRLIGEEAAHLGPVHRAWVVEQAAGNPLALLELAKMAAHVDRSHRQPDESMPPLTEPLQRIFAGPVRELPDAGRDVVLVAALTADPVLPLVLAAAAILHGAAIGTDVVEFAQGLGLFDLDDRRVRFAHSLVKAAIVQQEPMSRRQAAHRALGAVVQNSRQRAWHRALGAAAHDDSVAAELEATVPDSVRHGDTASAVLALERAAQLTTSSSERGRRLMLAATHAVRLGQDVKVLELLDAADGTELSVLDRIRGELFREEFDVVVIDDSERLIHLCAAADRAAVAGHLSLQLDLIEAAARRRCIAEISEKALARLVSIIRGLIARHAQDARAIAVVALADPIGHGREVVSALAGLDEAIISDEDDASNYGIAARAVGDYARAVQFFDRAEIPLRTRGLTGPLARNLCVTGDLRIELGQWDRAAADLTEFASLSTAAMSASHRASAISSSAKLAALRGDCGKSLELVGEVECLPSARRGNRFLARAQIARGIAAISAGQHEESYTTLCRVFDPADAGYHFREQFDAVAYLAEAAAHAGRHREAADLIQSMRRQAAEAGSPLLTAHLAYADAVLAPGHRAEPLFLQALASEMAGSRWHRARTQLAFGRWLRRRHRVTESRHWLKSSLAVFQELGAVRWATEALAELRAAGMPGSEDGNIRAGALLSAQELKIAHYAATGLTNKEIGEQLYLSPRTVGSHLYRLFPKLGISTRAQLAERLEEEPEQTGW